MLPGTVYLDNSTSLSEETGERSLIVLLTNGERYPFVFVKTTSRFTEDLGKTPGCKVDEGTPCYYLPLHSTYLKEDTWIVLDKFYEIDRDKLYHQTRNQIVAKVCRLPQKILIKLLPCAISCKSISGEQKQELWKVTSCIDEYYQDL